MPIVQKKKKAQDDPVLAYLETSHRSFCTYWVFSGDRHCSCGKDRAIKHYQNVLRLTGADVPAPQQEKELTNKMKVIIIAGYPGSGKSTIMRGVIEKMEQAGEAFKQTAKGSVTYMSSRNFIILGSYEVGEKFPGTDRYPMNVQPKAEEFILEAREMMPNKAILMEGDRLFNDKFLQFLKLHEFNVVLCLVQAQAELVEGRRAKRSEQNATWLKGRKSKVDRIALIYPFSHYLSNNNMKEQKQSIETIYAEASGEDKPTANQTTKIKEMWK